ncbi:MAG TPA: VOC family protein [Luteimonas sp.]|jgi:catechol 2,3-dioxygenase-like lactoylglutathione lyase family enzyme|nr:VOC family protein [Luteimonas sp.]
MTLQLDHIIVPAADRVASARLVAQLLGVPWSETCNVGPFSPVYVNEGLTLDFAQMPGPFTPGHFAFRVSPGDFEAILARLEAAGIGYRSTPLGPTDMQVNTSHGGRALYWSEPDGHAWEILTVSYARQPGGATRESA